MADQNDKQDDQTEEESREETTEESQVDSSGESDEESTEESTSETSEEESSDETSDEASEDAEEESSDESEDGESAAESSGESSDDSDAESSEEDSEEQASEAASSEEPEHEPEADAHDAGGHGHHDDHGISHVASTKVLLGTFGALMVLTILTVSATSVDLGSNMNLLVAMLIATVKASLVCAFFMHLKYDKAIHTVALIGALLFAMLFVTFALMDSSEYQDDIVWVEETE